MWTQRDILSLMVVGAMIGTALPAQADPVAAARRAHSRAVKLVADGDRAGAIRTYEKALIFAPAFPLALNELGVLLAAEERVDEAIARLEEAVNWSPDFVAAWSNLGAVARQNEDEDLCIDAYGQVLRIAPEDSGGWHGLAYCLLADEELSQALGALERFLELAPADSPVRADAAAAAEASARGAAHRPERRQRVPLRVLRRGLRGPGRRPLGRCAAAPRRPARPERRPAGVPVAAAGRPSTVPSIGSNYAQNLIQFRSDEFPQTIASEVFF